MNTFCPQEPCLPFPRQYGTDLLILESGQGCRVTDSSGRSYLDMAGGIAVNALGYGREDLAEVAAEQMRKLIHVSNLFTSRPAWELAEKLLKAPFPCAAPFAAVYFGNSGTEANEAALKYARLYAGKHRGKDHHHLVSFTGGFHGRTMGSLSLTANARYQEVFAPLLADVDILPFNDLGALNKALDGRVAGVILEGLQGEGGLESLKEETARTLNSLCRKHKILLIADEVQTGLGRCGTLSVSEQLGLEPDIITLSKPLGGGLPLSATLIPAKVNELLEIGQHGSTFGGGPVTTAVANTVWDIISQKEFLSEVRRKGVLMEELLLKGLDFLGKEGEVRGRGLLRGLRLENKGGQWCKKIIDSCRDRGLFVLQSGTDLIRLAPPLIINDKEIEEGIDLLFTVIKEKLYEE